MTNRIVIKPNGPLVLYGDIRLEDKDGGCLAQTDTVFLCRCGLSNNKPFCDGQHKRTGFSAPSAFVDDKAETATASGPLHVSVRANAMLILNGPMRIESEDGESSSERNKAALCRCGHSQNKPFCDASHKACGFRAE
jgi:CDGSH-type Zn-finger protein